jgi:hypothetical protein
MMQHLKDAGIFLLLLAAAGYGIYRGEQIFATIALILLIAVSYKHLARPFISRVQTFVGRVDYAKFRDLELRTNEQAAQIVRLEGLQLTVLQEIVLRNLEPEQCSVLANLSSRDRTPTKGARIERLRELRDRGLVEHDRLHLGESTEVWLTPLGKEVAELLRRPGIESQSTNSIDIDEASTSMP